MFAELVRKNRSYRRFYQEHQINRETLYKLIDYARLSPNGSNRQALRYYIACDPAVNAKTFDCLLWAMFLKNWDGPVPGERPSAYIAIVQDEAYKVASVADYGIAAQSILLGAVEMGLGGCMIANIRKDDLRQALGIPANQEILLVIALGKPKETIKLDEISAGGDIKYWREENGIHHVPKIKLEDIILN